MDDALTEPDDRRELVRRRVTCPFVGAAVMDGALEPRGPEDEAVAEIAALKQLGNAGGGRLGWVLAFFASANHGFAAGPSGRLDVPVPPGLFSLDFPGSQGSHPGHSGILESDPAVIASGRFSPDNYGRLADRAQDGHITRLQVASFIAQNLRRDPAAQVLSLRVAGQLLARAAVVAWAALESIARLALRQRGGRRPFNRALGRFAGCNNLVGAAGEFGLLFAFLSESPHTIRIGGQPALALCDLDDLFVSRRLPEGWRTWRKTVRSWAWNTLYLAVAAFGRYCGPASRRAGPGCPAI